MATKYLDFLNSVLKKLDEIIELLKHPKKPKTKTVAKILLELNRHQIGSINLSDVVTPETLLPEQRTQYLREAESLWKNIVFQNELKLIMRRQLEFVGMQAADFDQVMVARGTINGSSLLLEKIEQLHIQFMEKTKRPELVDERNKFDIAV